MAILKLLSDNNNLIANYKICDFTDPSADRSLVLILLISLARRAHFNNGFFNFNRVVSVGLID